MTYITKTGLGSIPGLGLFPHTIEFLFFALSLAEEGGRRAWMGSVFRTVGLEI